MGPPLQGEGVQICPDPRGGALRMQNLSSSLLGAQGYQRFPLSKPVAGWSIALHDVPAYMASSYLVSQVPGSPNFIFSKSSTLECVLNSESAFSLVVGMRFVSA